MNRLPKYFSHFLLVALLSIYGAYLVFILRQQQGAVDYETFMNIGRRFLNGQMIWVENSYYPLPFVILFGVFAAMPKWLSIILWHAPLPIMALLITRWNPLSLLFAPVFAHFLGGQTALPGMLGFWRYRGQATEVHSWQGGAWLALTLLKPQLAIAPVLWALWTWLGVWRRDHRLTRQMWGFLGAALLLYLPAFVLIPNWVSQWLASPRQVNERALAALVPRLLLFVLDLPTTIAYPALGVITVGLFMLIWRANGRRMTLDVFFLFALLVNPFIHDYDLILLLQ